jgi:hypothetical protein
MDTINRALVHGFLDPVFPVALGIVNFRKAVWHHAKNFRRGDHAGLATRAFILIHIRDPVDFFGASHKYPLFFTQGPDAQNANWKLVFSDSDGPLASPTKFQKDKRLTPTR